MPEGGGGRPTPGWTGKYWRMWGTGRGTRRLQTSRYTPAMVSMEYLVIEYLVNGIIRQVFVDAE